MWTVSVCPYCRIAHVFHTGCCSVRSSLRCWLAPFGYQGVSWLSSCILLLILGDLFFFLWPVEELVFVFRVLWFSQGKPRYGFFPFCFMAVGSVDACVDPSWKTAAYTVCVLAPRRHVVSWACVRSLLPSLSLDHLLPAFPSACLLGWRLVHSGASLV